MNRRSGYGRQMRTWGIVCGVLAWMGLAQAADLPAPIIWFSMDERLEDGRIPDLSGNGRHLTVGSGVSLGASRVKGNALVTDGSCHTWGYFACPALTDRTIAFWLFRNATDNNETIADADNKYPYLWSNLSYTTLMFEGKDVKFRQAIGKAASKPFNFFGPYRERWTHYAFTMKQTGVDANGSAKVDYVCYRNGSVIYSETETATGSISASNEKVYFLNNDIDGRGKRTMYGQVDEFRVFDTALTAEQVAQEMVRGLPADTPRLIGHWPFTQIDTADDGTRTTPDATGLSGPMELGADVTTVAAPTGTGLSFPGARNTSYASVLRNNFHALLDTTIAMWINFSSDYDEQMATVTYPRVWACGQLSNLIKDKKNATDRSLKVQWRNSQKAQWADPILALRDGWTHVTLVYRHHYDAESMTWNYTVDAYMNGQKSATLPALPVQGTIDIKNNQGATICSLSEVFENPHSHFTLANNDRSSSNGMAGSLADVRVYQGALSDEMIAALVKIPAAVQAGADFTVTTDRATLRAARAQGAGTLAWTCLSGAGAVILDPESAVTDVVLPTDGTYVFRVTHSSDAGSVSDDVTVTRAAAAGANEPPVVAVAASVACTLPQRVALTAEVSDPDGEAAALRIAWTRVSGPGAAWFEPADEKATHVAFSAPGTYVLACAASDGRAETVKYVTVEVTADAGGKTLADGLLFRYLCDPLAPDAETVSGQTGVSLADYVTTFYKPGRTGLGFAATGARAYFETSANLAETPAGQENAWPAEQYRTISAWIYHDTASTNRFKMPIIVGIPYTLWIAYNCPCADGSGNHDILVEQQGFTDATSKAVSWSLQYYSSPVANAIGANRWMHVCVVVDRQFGNHTVYVDGEQYVKRSGAPWGGRKNDNKLSIGGFAWFETLQAVGPNNYLMDEEGKELSRTFPGIVDDVMIWNRALSAGEVKRLAEDPYVFHNRAPQVVAPTGGTQMATVANAVLLAGTAYDDARPAPGTLTYAWEVVSGEAASVAISAPTAAQTDATFLEPGTYQLCLRVTDGEAVTVSPRVTYNVLRGATVILVR